MVSALMVVAAALAPALAADGPTYDSPQTRQVVEKMVAAHGGLEAWRRVGTLSYENIFFNPSGRESGWESPWWVANEVVDVRRRRAYQDWPLRGARLSFDGKQVWTEDWTLGNPPKFQAMVFFYFVALPFLTQDPGVRLGELGTAQIPGSDVTYQTVLMEFAAAPTVGKTARDHYELYIEPDTGLLRAYEYTVGYGAMLDLMQLPADRPAFGPMLRVHDQFTNVDGLVFPSRMHTRVPNGRLAVGEHILLDYSIRHAFDESRMTMPAGAVLDTSSAERATPAGP